MEKKPMPVVGALWENEKKGKKYLTGYIDLGALGQIKIGIFRNEKAEKNQPQMNICLMERGN